MAAETLLETHKLTKSFQGKTIIDNLNLNIKKGDVYGFLGRNGQGKTTTIRMLTGLIFPDSGEVVINGLNIRGDFKQAISQIGAIVENPVFYDYLSGYENLSLMVNLIPGIGKEKINEVLELVGLTRRAKDKVAAYSLGMKQRLGIANALLNDPQLIILDEPTNGLDPQGMIEIKEMILQLSSKKEITFFISSHLLHEVSQICNRVGILNDGKLLAEGDVSELINDSETHSLEEAFFNITSGGQH
ncbi:ABC transporter ATP-binding protein [Oceanobacillus oncorhynchi]|uniref:ABC transporter ATP-binding protein n=1 Tax=Oceanobacillus oncorhynchi TaxID=545501 RepID=UPI002116F7D8|nr:ATP-binding cassette domain-containing protein [Oceanobacillus oncorhynchi]UUI42043.1 ATP-binding cassette domain-containing protein [Oceanobacillus oncorhynchi]